MRRFVVFLMLALGGPFVPPALAQRAPRFDIAVTPGAALVEGPAVSSDRLLTDATTREHLRNGFPARIHYRLELWRKGNIFDDIAGRSEWDVLVSYDPTTQLYNAIRRSVDDKFREDFGGVPTLTSVEALIGKPFKPPLHPARSGRYYYNLVVDIQTLTQSDLDELQQWLRGKSAPGKTNNPLAVIGSGLGTLLSRVLGGSKVTHVTPSGVFTVE